MNHVQGTLASEERLRWLTEKLASDGSVTIAEPAEALGVSDMTIRRDLLELEQRGAARRVRGGATAVDPQTFAHRHRVHAKAKAQIAAKVAGLVPSSGVVTLDASSTVMRLGPALTGLGDLVVMTNGPDTFTTLQGQPGLTAILTGGQLDPRTGSLVGPIACRGAAQLAAQLFVASAAGVDEQIGATEATLDEAEVKRALAANAAQVVVAIDSSKLGRPAGAVGLDWDVIDVLVTELDADDGRLDPYRDRAIVR